MLEDLTKPSPSVAPSDPFGSLASRIDSARASKHKLKQANAPKVKQMAGLETLLEQAIVLLDAVDAGSEPRPTQLKLTELLKQATWIEHDPDLSEQVKARYLFRLIREYRRQTQQQRPETEPPKQPQASPAPQPAQTTTSMSQGWGVF